MSSFHFVPRPIEQQGAARRWSTLAAVGLSFLLGAIVLKAAGASPLAVYKVFFFDSMTSAYNATEIINKTVTLAVIALGLSVGFRANIWNIGAEGQFIVGAISASAVAIYFIEKEAPWVVLIVLLGGGIGGLLWSAIPAFLRAKITVNEILSSLMLVYVAQLLLSYVVHGPLKDPQGYNFPQSKLFSDSSLVPSLLEDERLFATIILLPFVALAVYWFIAKSWPGFQMRVAGLSPHSARYAGFSPSAPVWTGFLVTGFLAGIMGAVEVTGPIGQLTPVISPGYGFTAIIVAFLGRLNPLGIIAAAWMMAMIYIGGENAQIDLALPVSISGVFQGLILFSLLAIDFLVGHKPMMTAKKS